MSDQPTLFGLQVVVDETVPPDVVELRDGAEVVAEIVGVSRYAEIAAPARKARARYLEGMIVTWRHGGSRPTPEQRAAARELAAEFERRIREP